MLSTQPENPPSHRRRQGARYRLIHDLNQEWDHLVETCPDDAGRWGRRHTALRFCDGLADVVAAVERAPDEVLGALLAESRAGDRLAARVVLQTMLGKVVRMAARDSVATVDDYVAAMWCRIQTYPLPARPVRIAANLALDTLKAVCREKVEIPGRLVSPMCPDAAFDWVCTRWSQGVNLDHNPASQTSALDVIQAAAHVGIIDADTRDLLRSVYLDGLASRDAAGRHSLTAVNVRFRCSRAVRRMSQDRELLLDAA